MNSKRLSSRVGPATREIAARWVLSRGLATNAFPLAEMPSPLAVPGIEPDQIIEDILVSTLARVKKCAKPELAAAAARYMAVLQQKAT